MSEETACIVVAGDPAVDWFFYPVPGRDEGANWARHTAAHAAALPGGVFLLAEFVRQALGAEEKSIDVIAPRLPGELRIIPPEQVVHSNAMLDAFRVGKDGREAVLRIEESLGYIGPPGERPPACPPEPNREDAQLVVLDDAGNGFRDQPEAWPRALDGTGRPLVVYKMSRPLACGPLWERVTSGHADRQVLVVNAAELRRIPGVDISCALSWERTARDVAFHLQSSEPLQALRWCPYLVVLFGTDGALVHYGGETPQATLVFDPVALEGDFAGGISGNMNGLSSVFTASLAAGLAVRGISALEHSVRMGLARMRRLLQAGFTKNDSILAYPVERIFAPLSDKQTFQSCSIPRARNLNDPDPGFWRILDQKTRNTRPLVAEQIVLSGKSAGLLGVPVGTFGKLQTIDRAEIESYSAIRGLIAEFLAIPKPERPLSFAVFGPPGAGKSFGVKQVVGSLHAPDLEPITFNISQFRGYEDLVAAFHEVRNIALRGKIPFVFFDEFDSAGDDGPLSWLKYFLAPMQDGEFKEAGAVHPIGRAIFVFAGGTRSSFQEFAANAPTSMDRELDRRAAERAFQAAKGPDFVSRLRGYINVMGPNRQHADDTAFIIRRAMVLRSMLRRNPKAKDMFDSEERLRIDEGVLRALLSAGRYRHGTRSMEAIFDMSRLAGRERFDLAALPPEDQLDLHVDADEFHFLTQKERFVSMLAYSGTVLPLQEEASFVRREAEIIEAAAQMIHADYVRHRELEGKSDASTVSWEALAEDKRRSNRDAAGDIPCKLRSIRHGLRPVPPNCEPQTPDINDEEIERMARLEHQRWCAEQRLQGYTFGPQRDPVRKTSPYLVEFDRLPEEVRQYDVQSVMRIPAVLKQLGYEVYRMEEAETLDDPDLIDRLARAVHAAYVQERRRAGDTPETNPSLVEFDELPPDLKASNIDNAQSIPRKLKRLGYDLDRVRPGTQPRRLELTAEQIERLAIMEHSRWNWQRILQGWTFAPGPKNNENKTSPHLVPWARLPEEIREYDRETVRLIPDLLVEAVRDVNRAGYQVQRIELGTDAVAELVSVTS